MKTHLGLDLMRRTDGGWITRGALIMSAAPIVMLAAMLAGCAEPHPPDTPMQFVLDGGGAGIPTTAVDPGSGAVYWAWFGKDDEGQAAVYAAALRPTDSEPGRPVRVSPPEVSVNAHPQAPPQIAVSNDGTVYVVWSTRREIEGRRFPASHLQLARSIDGGRTFEAPIFVNDDASGPPAGHTFHNLATGPDGTVFVSWLDSRDDGEAHAQHHHHGASSTTVRVARSENGGQSFDPGVVVARGSCQCCRTSLHIAPNGTIYIAWRHIFGENTRDIAVARSENGGRTFSEPTRVHDDNWDIDGCPHAGPVIATDAGGNVHVGWYTAASGREGIYHAVSENGGVTFSEPEPLITRVPISRVDMAPTDPGVTLIWEDAPSGELHIRNTSDAALPLRRMKGSAPTLAHAHGITALAWEQEDGVRGAVWREADPPVSRALATVRPDKR